MSRTLWAPTSAQRLLIVAFLANAALVLHPFFLALFAAQVAFYVAAVAGYLLKRRGRRPGGLMIPFYFCVVNLAPLVAARSLLRGERKVTWETTRAQAG